MTGHAGFVGGQPIVKIRTIERTKYELMWGYDQYRQIAPGEDVAPIFLAQVKPKPGVTVIDFGAGTGRGALYLALFGQLRVEMLDFADNCLDTEIREMLVTQAHALTFTQHDLNEPSPLTARYGFCTDVMEHIPPDGVDRVLGTILRAAEHVFFQISCVDDSCGKMIGDTLHLSVHPYEWWLKKLQQDFQCVVHWSHDGGDACLFYVTAWTPGKTLVETGVLNIAEQQVLANVTENLKANWLEVRPYETNDDEVILLGGGWSLPEFVDEIRAKRESGMKLVTLNNSYHWALSQGLSPSAQIVVDARPFNARFTHPVVDKCLYLIASQVDPSVLDGLPRDRTWLWHTTMADIRPLLNAAREKWYGVPGGSTVALRAIPLLRMLGYRKFHCYGIDSCLRDKVSHCYDQPENDTDFIMPVTVGDGMFSCTSWMASQANEFMDLIKYLGDEIELEIYGGGLLAHILKTGAAIHDEIEAANEQAEPQT